MEVSIYGLLADQEEVMEEYGIPAYRNTAEIPHHEFEAIVLAVGHNAFLELDLQPFKAPNAVVYDVKGILSRNGIEGRL